MLKLQPASCPCPELLLPQNINQIIGITQSLPSFLHRPTRPSFSNNNSGACTSDRCQRSGSSKPINCPKLLRFASWCCRYLRYNANSSKPRPGCEHCVTHRSDPIVLLHATLL